MKINILLATILVLSMTACDKKAASSSTDSAAKPTTEQQAAVPVVSQAVAPEQTPITTALVAGTYETTLPCADCEGIKSILTLTEQGQYTLTEEYLGKGKPETSKGPYEITDNTIKIETDLKETVRYRNKARQNF